MDIDAKSDSGKTALLLAAAHGSEENVSILLARGAQPGLYDLSKRTALHFAAQEGHVTVAQRLLERDISIVKQQADKEQSALHIAARSLNIDLASVLLAQQPESVIDLRDQDGNSALLLVIKAERSEDESAQQQQNRNKFIELLIKASADLETRSQTGRTPLLLAVEFADSDLIKLLLDHGCNINSRDGLYSTALQLAARMGEEDIVRYLMDRGAKVDLEGGLYHTALQAATRSGTQEITELLLREGADVSLRGGVFGSVLNSTIVSWNDDLPRILIDQGASVDVPDDQGRTALHFAAWRGHWDLMTRLKDRGCIFSVKDHQRRTILHFAAMGGEIDMVQRLLKEEHSQQLDTKDIDGWTPLHWACRGVGSWELIVRHLMEGGGNLYQPDENGWTPEMIAVFHHAKLSIPSDKSGKPVEVAKNLKLGSCRWGCGCDGYLKEPIHGIRWRCKECEDFNFCMKCYWTAGKTHPKHRFEKIGEGPERWPEFESDDEETFSI